MRWRTEEEVIAGKGQFVCGAEDCKQTQKLKSYEVNFAYVEAGKRKQALVKLRVCPECTKKLFFNKPIPQPVGKHEITEPQTSASKEKDTTDKGQSDKRREKQSSSGDESRQNTEKKREKGQKRKRSSTSSSSSDSETELKKPKKRKQQDNRSRNEPGGKAPNPSDSERARNLLVELLQ